jgi:hypothetical protein
VKNPKPSHRGSVWGVPCETAIGDGRVWWWGGAVVKLVVVRLEVRGEAGGLGQKPEAKPPWLGFGLHPGGEGSGGHRNPSRSNLRG